MPIQIEGFVFEKPAEFSAQDVTMSFSSGGSAPTSLVVQSRPVPPGLDPEAVADEVLAELLQAVPGMKNGHKGEMAFDDGGKGVVVACSLSSARGDLRQYFVLRVGDSRVCTALLTAPTAGLTEAAAHGMMRCLSSLQPG